MIGARQRDERLRAALSEAPVPDAEAAEARGRALVGAAFARRRDARVELLGHSPSNSTRFAAALVALLAAAALALSPAGAAVRDWVGDAFDSGVPEARPGLGPLPGGGRLLVQSAEGPWIVRADGSRRLLGDYEAAGWSPRGLFVAVASGRTLSAVQPDGTPRWSLPAAGRVGDPRWSPSGLQIAYRAGSGLWVVDGDGEGARRLAGAAAPPAPAWSPLGLPLLAFVDERGRVRVASAETGEAMGLAPALPGISTLAWTAAGGLLEASPRALRVRPVAIRKAAGGLSLGAAREVALPPGTRLRAAAPSPAGAAVAALLERPGAAAGGRSEVLLLDPESGSRQRLFALTGRLDELLWSPDGSRLLTSWPQADQWLFVPALRAGRVRAIGAVAAEFSPGQSTAPFPRLGGWCCSPPGGPAG